MAAEQGYANAQYSLGWRYESGDGVPKDEIEALAWYKIAENPGDDSAAKKRSALELRLGRERTLVAQQRSNEILKGIEATKAR